MSALVVDIETAGEDWSNIDDQTKKVLIDRVTRWHPEIDDDDATESAQNDLGISPFTGEIVALGVLDTATSKGAVYYQAPALKSDPGGAVEGVKLATLGEKAMLEKFWELSTRYEEFVTFSGRTFDIPFLFIRSAIHNLRPSKDLMRGRYLYQQAPNARHIDLYDQLRFYGSMAHLGGLHLACRAFGIETSKDGEIDGAKVGEYFKAKKYQEIAEYNARDIIATAELYRRWQKFLAF